MTPKSWALAGLAAVALAAGPAPSTAEAGRWSAPANLGQDAATVGDVDIDDDGTAVAAWTTAGGPVRGAVRPAGSAFAAPVTLAPDGGRAVSAALDGRGRALVAWSRNGSLGIAERTIGAPALIEVATGVGGVASGPDVAFTGPGEAIVVWVGDDGAVHALSRTLGGATVPLPDFAPGPGNLVAHVAASGGHAVVAWTHRAYAGTQTTSTVRAAVRAPGGSFGAAEDLATASSDRNNAMNVWSGSDLASQRVVVSGGGAADVLFSELIFQGIPGEVGQAERVAARTAGGWAPAQHLNGVSLGVIAGRLVADLAAGAAGDALYVDGAHRSVPTMTFSARLRPAGAAGYGEPSVLRTGETGEIRAAPLGAGRFLVLMRSGATLASRAGSPATGFGDPLEFSGTDGAALLGLAGAPTGLGAALWVTTTGRVDAAVYDDSAVPADTVAPRLTRLTVSPKRFTERRRVRVRWRLSEPARVRLRVDRVRRGFRRGGRCVANRPRTGRIRRCERFRRAGTLTRAGKTGRTTVRFDRFVRRRDLGAGRYRITAVPRDAAGNRGRAKHARFTLLRRG